MKIRKVKWWTKKKELQIQIDTRWIRRIVQIKRRGNGVNKKQYLNRWVKGIKWDIIVRIKLKE